jgi:hypothetical protein
LFVVATGPRAHHVTIALPDRSSTEDENVRLSRATEGSRECVTHGGKRQRRDDDVMLMRSAV